MIYDLDVSKTEFQDVVMSDAQLSDAVSREVKPCADHSSTLKEVVDDNLQALGAFKDWSNYLLVTTVAAIGWIAQGTTPPNGWALFSLVLLALSASFGMLTLALIPVISTEFRTFARESLSIPSDARNRHLPSFYDLAPKVCPYYLWGKAYSVKLKSVCWPQHVLFIAGILAYVGSKFH